MPQCRTEAMHKLLSPQDDIVELDFKRSTVVPPSENTNGHMILTRHQGSELLTVDVLVTAVKLVVHRPQPSGQLSRGLRFHGVEVDNRRILGPAGDQSCNLGRNGVGDVPNE